MIKNVKFIIFININNIKLIIIKLIFYLIIFMENKNEKFLELMNMFDDENIKKKLSEQEYIDFVNKLKEVKEEDDKNNKIYAECNILKNEVSFDMDGNSEIKLVPSKKIFQFKNLNNIKKIKKEIEENGYWKNPLNKCKLAFPEILLEDSELNPIYYNTSEMIVKINDDISKFSKTYCICNCENNSDYDTDEE